VTLDNLQSKNLKLRSKRANKNVKTIFLYICNYNLIQNLKLQTIKMYVSTVLSLLQR